MNQLFHTAIFNAPNGNMMKYTITQSCVVGSNNLVPHTGFMKQYMDTDVANRIWNQYSETHYWRINQAICGNGEIFYDLSWFPMKGQICWDVISQVSELTTIYEPSLKQIAADPTKTTRSGKQY